MTVSVCVWYDSEHERRFVQRTRRRLPAIFERIESLERCELASRLRRSECDLWLLRAGAWLRDPASLRFPPPSATGLPLAAFGELDSPSDFPASLFVSRRASLQVAAILEASGDFSAMMSASELRSVAFRPLNVAYDSRLRILQVVTSLQRGGAERIACDLAERLPRMGVYARAVTIGRPLREPLEAPSGTIDLSKVSGDREHRLAALEALARADGIDVLHAHLLNAADLQRLEAIGIPIVATIHNQRPGWPAGIADSKFGEKTLPVACSLRVEQELRESHPESEVRTVWNGIDTAKFIASAKEETSRRGARRLAWGFAAEDFVLVTVANPRLQKRWDRWPEIVLAVGDELRKRGDSRRVRLLICGETELLSEQAAECLRDVRERIASHGLNEDVLFTGATSNVSAALGTADLYVSCSDHEGLSLAQLEALAAGLPLVVTETGGAEELSQASNAVRIVPREASSREFAQAVVELAMRAKDETGQAFVKRRFDIAGMVNGYIRHYSGAIDCEQSERGDGIWLIANNFSTGGAQSSARRLLEGLHRSGSKVRAAVLQEQPEYPTLTTRELRDLGIRVLTLPPPETLDTPRAVDLLCEEIAADRPRAVVFWNAIASYKVLLADRLLGVPVFDVSPGEMYFTSLEKYFAEQPSAIPYRSMRDYGRRLSGVVVKYAAEADRAREALGAPVSVIPNGIALQAPLRSSRSVERIVIGTAARISPQKKLEILFEALRSVLDRMPPFVLRIAGDAERGSEAYAIELRASAADLPIEWLGEVRPIERFLGDIDLFAAVSEPAGCPNATLEALACGVPVVATDFGGMSEQIEHETSGLLAPRNDPSAFGEMILRAAGDADLRRHLSQGGTRRVAERFSLERMIESYRTLFLSDATKSGME